MNWLCSYQFGRAASCLSATHQHVAPLQAGTRDGWSAAETSRGAVVVMEPARLREKPRRNCFFSLPATREKAMRE